MKCCYECGECDHLFVNCPYIRKSPMKPTLVKPSSVLQCNLSLPNVKIISKTTQARMGLICQICGDPSHRKDTCPENVKMEFQPKQKSPRKTPRVKVEIDKPIKKEVVVTKVDQTKYFIKKSFNANQLWKPKDVGNSGQPEASLARGLN